MSESSATRKVESTPPSDHAVGEFYQHGELPHFIARVDKFESLDGKSWTLFSIMDRRNPQEFGWSEGAALETDFFQSLYPTKVDYRE